VSLSREYFEKMSNFSKKIMIEAAELDRMQQSQLRNYSPELHSLAEIHNQMVTIIGDKSMSADEKLNLLSNYQGRFNKLKKETGVLIGTESSETNDDTQAVAAAVPQVANQADGIPADDESDDASPDKLLGNMGILPMYQNKARKLLIKINKNPNILKRNKKGEIIVKGKTVTGSDFSTLFKSMVGPKPDLRQPGTDSFMGALHEIGVKPMELSGKAVQSKFAQSKYVQEEEDVNNNEPQPKLIAHSNKAPSRTSKQKKTVTQTGKGIKRNSTAPPGTRPKILYVY